MGLFDSLKKHVITCTVTFKAFDHEVQVCRGADVPWDFTTLDKRTKRKFIVYCTDDVDSSFHDIKEALNKIPEEHRLVVVTEGHTKEDEEFATSSGFTLVSIERLDKYGREMLTVQQHKENEPTEEELDNTPDLSEEEKAALIDDLMTKEKLY